jgi:hypothetical protein
MQAVLGSLLIVFVNQQKICWFGLAVGKCIGDIVKGIHILPVGQKRERMVI